MIALEGVMSGLQLPPELYVRIRGMK